MVRLHSETADDAATGSRYHGLVAKCLALVHVAQVHLDNGQPYTADGIVQGNAGVRIGTCVEHNSLHAFVGGLFQAVDKEAFNIRLIVFDGMRRNGCAQTFQRLLHRSVTIDTRFATALSDQVWTIYY